jgi:D-amino-acid dehydrogenase
MKGHVAIIGAGISGCCTAYYLLKSGYEVSIHDRLPENDTDGCSFINCGYISPSHFVPLAAPGVITKGLKWMFNSSSPLYIKPRLDPELISWLLKFKKSANKELCSKNSKLLLEMNLKSRTLYDELFSEISTEKLYSTGLLILCNTEHGLEEESEVARFANSLGLEAKILSRKETHLMEPEMVPDVVGSVYFPQDNHFYPPGFMKVFRDHLRSSGAIFHFNSTIDEVSINKGSIVSISGNQTEDGADAFVLAAGSWSPELSRQLNLKLPIQAGKGYSLTVQNPEINLHHSAILAERKVALTPFSNALRVGGTMELSGVNHSIRQQRVDAIIKSSSDYLPNVNSSWFEGVKPEHGLRPVSPDGVPYIGKVAHLQNAWICTGHAMLGMSLGPISGQVVTEMIDNDGHHSWSSDLSPHRFS